MTDAAGLPNDFDGSASLDLRDPELAKRPRDARLIHMILAQYGCSSYQERVPLQLMDFAYRYTSSILQDALHLTLEGYATNNAGPARGPGTTGVPDAGSAVVGAQAVRLAVHSRTHYQYAPALPKEVLLGIAQDRNQVALPPVSDQSGSMHLPPEQFLLTGQGWTLADNVRAEAERRPDVDMQEDKSEDEAEEVEGGVMEDLFGAEKATS